MMEDDAPLPKDELLRECFREQKTDGDKEVRKKKHCGRPSPFIVFYSWIGLPH